MATMLDIAEMYVRKFHAIVPVGTWTYTDKGGEEVDLWKAPLISKWTTEPLRTEQQVREQWGKYAKWGKTPNIGIVTGQICGGYIVIDLDNKPEKGVNGYEELKRWQRETGLILPEETWTAITGSGGYHLWFHTDRAMRGYVNDDIGIDLRADGNQVVVPPSMHRSGNRYQWEIAPKDCKCAEADEAVYRFIEAYRPTDAEYRQSTFRGEGGDREMLLPKVIPSGGRHDPLISLIGTLNKLGVSDHGIETLIRIENETKCKPPLTEQELQREIFPAIYRWEKGVSKDLWKSKETYLKEQMAENAQRSRTEQALKRAARNRQ
jgi:hypothetical protein